MSPLERRQRRLAVAAHKLAVLSILRQQWGAGVLPLVDVSHGSLKPVRDGRWEDSGQGPVGG